MSKINKLREAFLNIVCVKKCVACKELLPYDYEKKLCPECHEEWELAKREVCPYCYDMQKRCMCGFGKRYVDSVRHLALYSHEKKDCVTNRIVYALKKSNNDDVFDFVAGEIVKNLISKNNLSNAVVVSIPRNPNAIRRHGYDHAKKLAEKVAALLGVKYVDVLGHYGGKTEQKMLNKHQREINARKNCYIKQDKVSKIEGRNIFLADDIGTTGAMTGICAELLKKHGALSVNCILAAKNKK